MRMHLIETRGDIRERERERKSEETLEGMKQGRNKD